MRVRSSIAVMLFLLVLPGGSAMAGHIHVTSITEEQEGNKEVITALFKGSGGFKGILTVTQFETPRGKEEDVIKFEDNQGDKAEDILIDDHVKHSYGTCNCIACQTKREILKHLKRLQQQQPAPSFPPGDEGNGSPVNPGPGSGVHIGAVPEPSTFVLLGMGVTALTLKAWRTRKDRHLAS